MSHVLDVLQMPPEILTLFEKGSFVVSISSRKFHPVGLGEAHEMLINQHTKQAIVHPTNDYINRIAQYIPHRMKSTERLKGQIFPEEHDKKHHDVPTIFTGDVPTRKSELNIQAEVKRMDEVNMLPVLSYNRGLVNIFR